MEPGSKWTVNMLDRSAEFEVTFVSREGSRCTVTKADGTTFVVHRRFLRPAKAPTT